MLIFSDLQNEIKQGTKTKLAGLMYAKKSLSVHLSIESGKIICKV